MWEFFETQKEVIQDDCLKYAQNLVKSPVNPVPWQGYHSYTLLSESSLIVRFRFKASPLDMPIITLAKQVHGNIAPATTYQRVMSKTSLKIWLIEALPAVGYLSTICYTTVGKQDTIVIDMAR